MRGKHPSRLVTLSRGHTLACTFEAPELLKSFLPPPPALQFGEVIISGEQLVEGQRSKHKR